MKTSPNWNAGLLAAVVAGLGLTAACSAAETSVKLADAPAAVRDAITAAAGKPVDMIDKEQDNGKTYYEADYEMKGTKCSVKVDEAGTVVERETAVTKKELPKAVRAALKAKYPKAQIKEAEKVEANGETYFELHVTADKKSEEVREVKVSTDGKITADESAAKEEAGEADEADEKGEKGEMNEKDEKPEMSEKDEKGEKAEKGEMNEKDEHGEHAD